MRMRKLFAGLAAAATLLSGLAIGASTANADPVAPNVETPALPFAPLQNTKDDQGNDTYDKVDAQGKVTAQAQFKFTAEDGTQWGQSAGDSPATANRVIRAFKLADYYQYVAKGDVANPAYDPTKPESDTNPSTIKQDAAVYGVQVTADTALQKAVRDALKTALAGVKAKDGDAAKDADGNVAVPDGTNDKTDPMAWALQYGYLDQSATKPWDKTDGATDSTTRKFADALQTALKNSTTGYTELTSRPLNQQQKLTIAEDGSYATADLEAGIYLFLDVTRVVDPDTADQPDTNGKNWINNGNANDNEPNSTDPALGGGKVIVNSAPIILASGHLVKNTGEGKDGLNYLYPIGNVDDKDNTVAFKNHVTPITKAVGDQDKTVSTGQVVRYQLTTTLPVITGVDKTLYKFAVTDYPGTGQTINLNGIAGPTDAKAIDPATNDGNDREYLGYKFKSADGYKGQKYTVKIYDVDEKTGKIKDPQPAGYPVQLDRNGGADDKGNQLGINGTSDFTVTGVNINATNDVTKDIIGNDGKQDDGTVDPTKQVSFTFDFANLLDKTGNQYAGKALRIEFDAKITADGKNNANDGGDDVPNRAEVNDRNAVSYDDTSLHLGRFQFIKTDAQGNALNGARFQIKAKESAASDKAVAVTPVASDKDKGPFTGFGVDQSDSSKGMTLPDKYNSVSQVGHEENGLVTFTGLADGEYTVTEIKTPNGYLAGKPYAVSFDVTIKNNFPVKFTGNGILGLAPNLNDDDNDGNAAPNGTEYKVKNVKNITQLPLTGAAGIALFGIVGLLLAAAAGTVFAKSRSTKRALRHA